MEILAFLRQSAGDYPCPGCRTSLADCGMDVREQEAGLYRVEVTCAACKVSFVVLLQVGPDGEAPAAVPPITSDELLDLHQALRGHEGSLSELFAQEARPASQVEREGPQGIERRLAPGPAPAQPPP